MSLLRDRISLAAGSQRLRIVVIALEKFGPTPFFRVSRTIRICPWRHHFSVSNNEGLGSHAFQIKFFRVLPAGRSASWAAGAWLARCDTEKQKMRLSSDDSQRF